MYEIGMLILYNRKGVYEIESMGAPPLQEDDGRIYYKLRPAFAGNNEIIYIPVDGVTFMRPLISGQEASEYLDLYSRLKPQIFSSRKITDLIAHYRNLVASDQVKDYLLLLKEIYVKQRDLADRNKKLGQIDAQYLKLAERVVCEEFAIALHTAPELIRKRLYTATRVKATA